MLYYVEANKGALIWKWIKQIEEGEHSTKFCLGLEMQKKKHNTITSFNKSNEIIYTKDSDVLKIASFMAFYINL
jgi:hypothetical protein